MSTGLDKHRPECVVPFVHLNGTSGQTLLDQREAVWNALEAVRDTLCRMAPNGRDYYPYPDGPAKMEAALLQHRQRLQAVDSLQAEIKVEMNHIAEHLR